MDKFVPNDDIKDLALDEKLCAKEYKETTNIKSRDLNIDTLVIVICSSVVIIILALVLCYVKT
jgi:hypothetical protein